MLSPELTSLHELAYYVREQVGVKECDPRTYVSTESMVPNKGGVTVPGSIPTSGKVSKYHSGDVLLSNIRPYYRKIWKADCDGCCSTDVLVIRAKDSRLSDYLFAVLSDERFFDYVMQGSKGTKMPRGDKNQILNYQIIKTDTTSMNNIGFLDSLILNNIRTIEAINANLASIIDSIFTETIKSSQGETTRFGSMIKIGSGGTPKTAISEYWNGDIPFFSPKDVDGIYVYSTEKYITKMGLDNCNSGYYPKNTTFITARGTVGKIALAASNMAMNQSCYAISANTLGQEHYIHQLSLYAVGAIKQKSNGTIFDAINARDITEELVPNVPLSRIEAFEKQATPLYEQIWKNGLEIESLVHLRDYLLPKLMSGEIDVSDLPLPN